MTEFPSETRRHVHGLRIAAGVLGGFAVLALIFWQLFHVILVVFAAILLAVFLDGFTRAVERRTRLPRVPSLALVVLLLGQHERRAKSR